jgi:nitrogen fixation protein FixH
MQKALTGRHVFLLLASFFAVVLIANGLMAYFAISTFSGTVGKNPYRQGRVYDDEIARAEAQDRRNWTATIEHQMIGDGRLDLRFTPAGPNGEMLSGLTVEALFNRPTQAAWDRRVKLTETESGLYQGTLALPHQGVWMLELNASRGDERLYRTRNRIVVK